MTTDQEYLVNALQRQGRDDTAARIAALDAAAFDAAKRDMLLRYAPEIPNHAAGR
jgi:hypothetical protein